MVDDPYRRMNDFELLCWLARNGTDISRAELEYGLRQVLKTTKTRAQVKDTLSQVIAEIDAMELVEGEDFAASLSQPARAEFEGGTMLGEMLAGVPDDLLHPRDVLLKGDRTLESVAGPEFLNHLRVRGMVDRVCDRCRLPYLTARPGPVCAGCLSDDERRAQSIATLDEMAASNENVTGR